MSSGQQIIKILAIIFAVFLIVNICGWALVGISVLIGISSVSENNAQTIEFSEVYEQPIKAIKVETAISKLTIKTGTELKVEGSNLPNEFSSKINGFTLVVKEEGNKKWFNVDITSELIITVPKEITLDSLEIKAGIGNNNIQDICINELDLECGVGVMQISNLTTLSKTKIDGGAGKCVIENSHFTQLDLETGVGEMVLSADIIGVNNKVDCGVGRVELNLLRTQEDYTITTSTGLGRMVLNGKRCGDKQTYGTGENKLKVSGGVGAIEITTL